VQTRPVIQKMSDNNQRRLVHVGELGAPSPSGSCVSHRGAAEEDGREQTAVWFREGYEPARAGQQLALEHASGVLPRSMEIGICSKSNHSNHYWKQIYSIATSRAIRERVVFVPSMALTLPLTKVRAAEPYSGA
jgi:hypothetical protein